MARMNRSALRSGLAALLLGGLLLSARVPTVSAAPATLEADKTEFTFLSVDGSADVELTWDTNTDKKGFVKVKVEGGSYKPTGLEGKTGTEKYTVTCCQTYTFALFDKDDTQVAGPVKVTTELVTFKPIPLDLGCSKQCITKVGVEPHGTFAKFHLETNEPAGFLITASEQGDLDSKGEFTTVDGFPIFSFDKDLTSYDPTYLQLKPDTLYHYIVKAKDKSGNFSTQTGTFKTLKRMVKVTFESIHIDDDSDSLSDGDLAFEFWANGQGGSGEIGAFWPTTDPGDDWAGTGDTLHPNFTITATAPLSSVHIEARGYDDDDDPDIIPTLDTCGLVDQPPGISCVDYETAFGDTSHSVEPNGPGLEEFSDAFDIHATGDSLEFSVHGTYAVFYK